MLFELVETCVDPSEDGRGVVGVKVPVEIDFKPANKTLSFDIDT